MGRMPGVGLVGRLGRDAVVSAVSGLLVVGASACLALRWSTIGALAFFVIAGALWLATSVPIPWLKGVPTPGVTARGGYLISSLRRRRRLRYLSGVLAILATAVLVAAGALSSYRDRIAERTRDALAADTNRQIEEARRELDAANDVLRADNTALSVQNEETHRKLESAEADNALLRAGLDEANRRLDELGDIAAETGAVADDMSSKLDELLAEMNAMSGARRAFTPEEQALIDRALVMGDARARARAAILSGDFAVADNAIGELERAAQTDVSEIESLRGDRYLSSDDPDRAIEHYTASLRARPDDPAVMTSLANALIYARRGDKGDQLDRAIKLLLGADEAFRASGDMRWAIARINLGAAYARLGKGDESANEAAAEQCFKQAIAAWPRDAYPEMWATVYSNLADLYSSRSTGDRVRNLTTAIDMLDETQQVWTRDASPREWAYAEWMKGIAWARLPGGDAEARKREAIGCFERALACISRETDPFAWANYEYWLGAALAELARLSPSVRVGDAVEHLRAAEEVITRETWPVKWAEIHRVIGMALGNDRRSLDPVEAQKRALAEFDLALEALSPEATPLEWVDLQNARRAVLVDVRGPDRAASLDQAIALHDDIRRVLDPGGDIFRRSETYRVTGDAWRALPAADAEACLAKAVEFYQLAIAEGVELSNPSEWVEANIGLARAWEKRTTPDPVQALANAAEHWRMVFVSFESLYRRDEWDQRLDGLSTQWPIARLDWSGRTVQASEASRVAARYLRAVEHTAPPETVARALMDLAVIQLRRGQGLPGEYEQQALSCAARALELLEPGSPAWGRVRHDQGQLLRVASGEPVARRREAVTALEEACAALAEIPEDHAIARSSLDIARAELAASEAAGLPAGG